MEISIARDANGKGAHVVQAVSSNSAVRNVSRADHVKDWLGYLENVHAISLTDMLRAKDGDFFIADWLRNRNTVEFLGIWQSVHNPSFNYGEFAII